MKPYFYIARRYLFAHRRKSVINVISWISLTGIAVGAMALIIVLSVYNGIGNLTQSLFNAFDPPLLVEPTEGKTFDINTIAYDDLCAMPNVTSVSQIVEENAWVTYNQNQSIVQLRGVDDKYPQITGLDTMIHMGNYLLHADNLNFLLLGGEVFYQLGIRLTSNVPIAVHIPRRQKSIGYTMDDAFNNGYAYPAGMFYIQQDIDSKYIVADVDFVRSLMDYGPSECTSLAININPKGAKHTQADVEELLGPNFTVKNRFEQQPLYYKIYRNERFGIILILSLIILISTLSLIASLSLLIIDKHHDVKTLRSMGMTTKQLRQTFFTEGIMISMVGVVIGMVVGFILCFIQQQFGVIKMGDGFAVSAFPVAMRLIDFVATFVLVILLSSISVYFTVRRAKL